MYGGLHVKYRNYCQIVTKLNSFDRLSKTSFQWGPSSMRTDRRTDGHDEARNFANALL